MITRDEYETAFAEFEILYDRDDLSFDETEYLRNLVRFLDDYEEQEDLKI